MISFQRKKVEMEEELLRPYNHLVRFRTHESITKGLTDVFQYWLKIPDSKLKAIKGFMKMFINFTCIFDDLQDKSLYRKTIPSANSIYGEPFTINIILQLFGMCLEKIRDLKHPEAVKIFISHFLEIIRGQGEDLFRRENRICPTEEEYKELARKKSSVVYLMFLRLMQLFSENKTDYSKVVTSYGIYYLISEDYFNLMKQENMHFSEQNQSEDLKCVKENHFCEDLTRAKFIWPVVHALQNPEGHELIYMMRQHTKDMGVKVYYRSLLERLGSVEYTRNTLKQYDVEIRKELAEMGGNPAMEELLNDLRSRI